MRSGSSATGNNSFNNLVGTGSNKHVVGLDAGMCLFSSSCPIVVKQCSFSFVAVNEAEVLDTVESTFVIVFLMLSIFSVKKFIKSLLLNCAGIFRSGDICLFVNLATVLNKNLGLFWSISMSLRICSFLASFRACLKLDILFFHAILKTSKLVFLHLRSRLRVSFLREWYNCCTMAQHVFL